MVMKDERNIKTKTFLKIRTNVLSLWGQISIVPLVEQEKKLKRKLIFRVLRRDCFMS